MKCINVPDLELNDGATRIFINTFGKNQEEVTPEFIELMHYINVTREDVANKCQSPRVREIHKRLERIRSNEEVGVRWMQEWEEKLKIKKEAEKKGMEEGLRMGREEARKAREEGIRALLITSFELGAADDVVSNKLMELFHLTEDETRERISRYRESV